MGDDNYINKIKLIVKESKFIESNPYIVGIGEGNKIIEGYTTNIPCLTFLVNNKIPQQNIEKQYLIPKSIYGIVTDVIAVGRIETNTDTKRQLAYGGMSIQNVNNRRFGSIGYAVTERETKQNLYILSCNSIITTDLIGTLEKSERRVLFPRINEGGTLPKGVIGLVKEVVKLNEGYDNKKTNEVDAGIVYIGANNRENKQTILAPYLGDKNKTAITGTTTVKAQEEVWRFGAETGKVFGKVHSTSMKIQRTINEKAYIFENQIMVKMLSKDGDNGALGITIQGNKAFGLQMSESNTEGANYTYFNPINRVLDLLKIKLVD